MAKHVVGTVDEIPPGERKIIELAGRSIGIFNVGGEFYALRNTCPHQGGPLCQGRVTGFLMARVPGEYSYTRRGEIVRCPWHGWEFDIKTGQSWFDPVQTRVRAYPVSVESVPIEHVHDGSAEREGGESASQESFGVEADTLAGLQKGPYTAETYDVMVEQRAEKQVIVVEIP
jgi:3-phenylpropionate/trans-cinnamate dioxygenase ferredoxin subunit